MKKPLTRSQKVKIGLLISAVWIAVSCGIGALLFSRSDLGEASAKYESNLRRYRELGLIENSKEFVKSIQVDPALNAGPELQALYASDDFKRFIPHFMDPPKTSSRSKAKSRAKPLTIPDADWLTFKPFVAKLQKIAGKPYCVISRNWTYPMFTLFPEFASSKKIVRGLVAQAYISLEKGETQESLSLLRLATRISSWQDNEHFLIAGLIRLATASVIERQIAFMLETPNANREFVTGLKLVLDELMPGFSVRKMIATEAFFSTSVMKFLVRSSLVSALKGLGDKELTWEDRELSLMAKVSTLRDALQSRVMEIYVVGFEKAPTDDEAYSQWEKACTLMETLRSKTGPSYRLANLLVGDYLQVVTATERERSQLNVLIQAQKAKEIYFATGKYPSALPVSGKFGTDTVASPARLKLDTANGFKVWSIGRNKMDDHGEYTPGSGSSRKDDFIVSLPK